MGKYDDWHSTMNHHTIESQVIADLRELLSIPAEVLDKLGGEELEDKLTEILAGYKDYAYKNYQENVVMGLTDKVVDGLRPLCQQWLKDVLFPILYPRPAMVSRMVIPSPAKEKKLNQEKKDGES